MNRGNTSTHNASQSKPHITPRQLEVLRKVASGLTNRQIGGALEISPRTVEVHRFNMMRKMGVTNVAQLLRGAIKHKLLPPSLNIG